MGLRFFPTALETGGTASEVSSGRNTLCFIFVRRHIFSLACVPRIGIAKAEERFTDVCGRAMLFVQIKDLRLRSLADGDL